MPEICMKIARNIFSPSPMFEYSNIRLQPYSPCSNSSSSWLEVEVDLISASVSVSAPNVDKRALSADIRFGPKAVVPHSVHFQFRRAAVGKFGGCRK